MGAVPHREMGAVPLRDMGAPPTSIVAPRKVVEVLAKARISRIRPTVRLMVDTVAVLRVVLETAASPQRASAVKT